MIAHIWRVRDLHAENPDDYCPNSYDVVVVAAVGGAVIAYSDEIYTTSDAAEVALAGMELAGLQACIDDWRINSTTEDLQ